jgi:Kae1-associated kinase Bud32
MAHMGNDKVKVTPTPMGWRLLFEPWSSAIQDMEAWIAGERLHLGAEAEVIAGTWHGRPAIQKTRRPRTWRHPDLDRTLTRRRMTNEVKLMIWLHAKGASIPPIWDVDFEEGCIIMARVEGRQLIDVLQEDGASDGLLHGVGIAIRSLHRNGVTHGDLSTNNILITPSGESRLIDLGLANMEYELEGYGIDLHVLHEILGASHPDVKDAMKMVLDGYLSLDEKLGPAPKAPGGEVPSAKDILKRLEEIKTRVRYHGG